MLHGELTDAFRIHHKGKVRIYALIFERPENGGPPLDTCALDFSGSAMRLSPEMVWATELFDAGETQPLEFQPGASLPDLKIGLVCERPPTCLVNHPAFDELQQQPETELDGVAIGLFKITGTAALAITTLADRSDSRYYEVTIDGAQVLPSPLPAFAITAAAKEPDGDRILFGGTGTTTSAVYILGHSVVSPAPALPLEFLASPRDMVISSSITAFVVDESGALFEIAPHGWRKLSSIDAGSGENGRVAWLRERELYHSAPSGSGLYRYASGTSARINTTMIDFEHGDSITLLTGLPPLGVVIGTTAGQLMYGEGERWTSAAFSVTELVEPRVIVGYEGGYLIGGGSGKVHHASNVLEPCGDAPVKIASSVVVGLVRLDGGFVVLARRPPPQTSIVTVLR